MPSSDVRVPQARVPLAAMTTLGVGGLAEWFVRAETAEAVHAAGRACSDRDMPLTVLGGGSNLVVADGGVRGLVLHVAIGGVEFRTRGARTSVRVGAGEPWDRVVAASVARELAGLECLSGIPGASGGTPVQNVGAYGQEVAGVVSAVTALDRRSGAIVTIPGGECRFGYRTSRFKGEEPGRFVVCEVSFDLAAGPPTVIYPDVRDLLARRGLESPTLADVREAVLSIRRRKGMVIDPSDPDTRSVGSFFVNPVVGADRHAELEARSEGAVPGHPVRGGGVRVPAAWLVEQAGFGRGYRDGAVGLSSKHPLAIVTRGGATARDVVALAGLIKRRVADRFGIWLEAEPEFVGFGDDSEVAFLKAISGHVDTAD